MNREGKDYFIKKKLGGFSVRKDLLKIDKNNSLVSYDYCNLYPSAQADVNSTWPKIETANTLKKYVDAVYMVFNSARWDELKITIHYILTVKNHSLENMVFQHVPTNGKINNPYKKIEKKKLFELGMVV